MTITGNKLIDELITLAFGLFIGSIVGVAAATYNHPPARKRITYWLKQVPPVTVFRFIFAATIARVSWETSRMCPAVSIGFAFLAWVTMHWKPLFLPPEEKIDP